MAQLISYSTEGDTISGTIRDHSPGNPERFQGFNLPRSEVKGTITDAKLATALGIKLTDPEPPTVEDQLNAAQALLPEGFEVVPVEVQEL